MRPAARLALVVVLVVLAVGGAWPAGASSATAQGVGERIVAFVVDLTINQDTTVDVTEQIHYDFGDNQRHGIFREIPVRFDYDPDPKYERVTKIDHVSVRAGADTPHDLKIEGEGRFTRFRIGDPDRTITGVHDYTISYRVHGAMNGFPEHDELFWNATGNEWPVPVEQVLVSIHAPGRITDVACYAGPTGSALACEDAVGGNSGEATFSQHDLSAGEASPSWPPCPRAWSPTPGPSWTSAGARPGRSRRRRCRSV